MVDKINRAVHIVLSDIHIGSKLGLCPPVTGDELGGSYLPNLWQQWTWEAWERSWEWAWQQVDLIEKENEGQKIHKHLSIVGDCFEIDIHGRSNQVWASNQHVALETAKIVLEPICEKFDTVTIFKGTEAHNGLGNYTEDMLAAQLPNIVKDPMTGEPAWWSGDLELAGVNFNMAHHGRIGRKPWTKLNPLESLRAEIILDRVDHWEAIPDVVFRGHFHQLATTDDKKRCLVVQLPGWQAKTAFVYRVDPVDTKPEVGLALVECWDGKFALQSKTYVMPREEAWNPEKSI